MSTEPRLHSFKVLFSCVPCFNTVNSVYTVMCQPEYFLTLVCPALLCDSLQCLQALEDGKQSKPCPSLHYTANAITVRCRNCASKPTAGDKGPISVCAHLCLCLHLYCMCLCTCTFKGAEGGCVSVCESLTKHS